MHTCSAPERGRHTSRNGAIPPRRNVHPSMWCRNAERAKNHGFCSWTMNASPVTANASGHVSRHRRDFSRPCTSPSSAPPASISTSAHEPCAYMWIAELVKNAITGHSNSPSANEMPGHRYLRHRRFCHTSRPTIASQRRHSPTKRIPTPKSQWTISAGGCTVRPQVGEHGPRDDEREQDSCGDDDQRRLDREPPEPLPARVQQGDAVGLQDRPDEPARRDERAEVRHRERA